MLTLTVTICTYGPAGIKRVEKMIPPPGKGVDYVVSWQESEGADIPESLRIREDVSILRLSKKGLSNNRNNAIEHSKGDIILIADDDEQLYDGFASKITESFSLYQNMDLGLFRLDYAHKMKRYPEKTMRITLPYPKGYYVNSVELALRRESLKDLRFYPELGLGSSKMHAGEEELLLLAAVKRGMNCVFIDRSIGRINDETTSSMSDPAALKGMGFIIQLTHPFSFIARVPLKAYRESKSGKISFFKAFKSVAAGACKAMVKRITMEKKFRW